MTKSKKRAGCKVKSTKANRITKRIVNTKRHTTGYVFGGKNMTVAQTRKMAAAGTFRNVQVVGKHVQAKPGTRRLSDLPMVIK